MRLSVKIRQYITHLNGGKEVNCKVDPTCSHHKSTLCGGELLSGSQILNFKRRWLRRYFEALLCSLLARGARNSGVTKEIVCFSIDLRHRNVL